MGHRDDSPLKAGFQLLSAGMRLIRDIALNEHGLLLSLNLGDRLNLTAVGKFDHKKAGPVRERLTDLLWGTQRQKGHHTHAWGNEGGGFRLISS